MANELIKTLRENTKTGDLFDCNASVISYKTGFPVLDYYLGYIINVYDENDELSEQYPTLGITAGSNVVFFGKPSTGKTSAFVSIAANIVRSFKNGTVIHFDIEQAMNYTRLGILTKLSMKDMADGKYVLRQEKTSLDSIKKTITEIYLEKINNPDKYLYDTGYKNEFNKPITLLEPTVIIIDSIASLCKEINENTKDGIKQLSEIASQTDQMRMAAELGRFYKEILPMIRSANINVMAVNQLKVNPNMGIVKTPGELLYMKQDEATPGGTAPRFYAHDYIKFVALGSEKYTIEEDGFDGFGVQLQIIKSRTNSNGKALTLIFDTVRGFDSIRSSVQYAKEQGLLGGNKNGYYFINNKEEKFTKMNMLEDFRKNRKLVKIMYEHIIPELTKVLSAINPEEMEVIDELMDY